MVIARFVGDCLQYPWDMGIDVCIIITYYNGIPLTSSYAVVIVLTRNLQCVGCIACWHRGMRPHRLDSWRCRDWFEMIVAELFSTGTELPRNPPNLPTSSTLAWINDLASTLSFAPHSSEARNIACGCSGPFTMPAPQATRHRRSLSPEVSAFLVLLPWAIFIAWTRIWASLYHVQCMVFEMMDLLRQ